MRVWGRKSEFPAALSVALAAGQDLSRSELLRKTLSALARDGRVDRIGVWLETGEGEIPEHRASAIFRGVVWDRQGENVPAEWQQLSPQAPLPQELLAAGRSVELDQDTLPMIGPLLELRHAVLVPVERRGRLRGVLLAGRRQKHGEIPVQLFEFAAELALTMELEEEHRQGAVRCSDLLVVKQLLADLSATRQPDQILSDLAGDCTAHINSAAALGAAFAVIGALRPARAPRSDSHESQHPGPFVDFLWKSGEHQWIDNFENLPFARVWRQALAEHRPAAGESESHTGDGPSLVSARTFIHVVAVPFESDGRQIGVLVAGFDHAALPATIERLELRAALAATALAARGRNQEEARLAAWRKSLLDNGEQATVLIDEDGGITGMSVAACLVAARRIIHLRLAHKLWNCSTQGVIASCLA